MSEGWRARLRRLIVDQLTQGVTPQRIALTFALGALLSVFPVFGMTTALCTGAALWLRLNQPLIQLLNAVLAPVHLLLLYPFYRAGERLFGQEPAPLLAIGELVQRFGADPRQFIVDYGMIAAYGCVVWLLVSLLVVPLMYLALKPLLASLARGLRPRAAP
ncbi:MAG TPA: DUF2062 domain-containing protein [Solimonas sp.]|nr:DUF2062 domain-containing protein [Solimonas sp.]